jgi:hypothetical protein
MLAGPLTQILFALRCRRRVGRGFQVHLARLLASAVTQILFTLGAVQRDANGFQVHLARLRAPTPVSEPTLAAKAWPRWPSGPAETNAAPQSCCLACLTGSHPAHGDLAIIEKSFATTHYSLSFSCWRGATYGLPTAALLMSEES